MGIIVIFLIFHLAVLRMYLLKKGGISYKPKLHCFLLFFLAWFLWKSCSQFFFMLVSILIFFLLVCVCLQLLSCCFFNSPVTSPVFLFYNFCFLLLLFYLFPFFLDVFSLFFFSFICFCLISILSYFSVFCYFFLFVFFLAIFFLSSSIPLLYFLFFFLYFNDSCSFISLLPFSFVYGVVSINVTVFRISSCFTFFL